MKMITNRAAIIVRPKAPFIEWVRNASNDSDHLSAKVIRDEPNVYLVRDYEMEDGNQRLIAENYRDIFHEELFGWVTDESLWPKQRDLKTFKQWFKVDLHALVLDLSDEEYRVEE